MAVQADLSPSPGNGLSYAQSGGSGRSIAGFAVVILLHVGLIYLLVTGLGRQVVEVFKHPVIAEIITERQKPQEELPPPPPPTIAPPSLPYIPPPEIEIQRPVFVPQNAITATTNVKPETPAPVLDSEVSARPVAGPSLVYPQRMLDNDREGSADIDCTIEATGSTSNCVVVNSVGGSTFAQAALDYVSKAKYRPRVRNGVAVSEEHHRIHINFTLK